MLSCGSELEQRRPNDLFHADPIRIQVPRLL